MTEKTREIEEHRDRKRMKGKVKRKKRMKMQ